jgi:hypothetical protein
MINHLREKRIKVDIMPNSLLMEINSLRSRYHVLGLANTGYLDMVVALAYCLS